MPARAVAARRRHRRPDRRTDAHRRGRAPPGGGPRRAPAHLRRQSADPARVALQRLSGLDEEKFNCCVDLGYAALDTIGNADETRRWAEALHYDSLIVVTASYHMPRSLAELARAMPNDQAHSRIPSCRKDLRRRRLVARRHRHAHSGLGIPEVPARRGAPRRRARRWARGTRARSHLRRPSASSNPDDIAARCSARSSFAAAFYVVTALFLRARLVAVLRAALLGDGGPQDCTRIASLLAAREDRRHAPRGARRTRSCPRAPTSSSPSTSRRGTRSR